MAPRDNEPSLFDDQEEPDLTPLGEDFELYRHKDADKMRTKWWHGYYRARPTEGGDYEIRSVPSSLGEYSVPGRLMPKDGLGHTTRRLICRESRISGPHKLKPISQLVVEGESCRESC